MGEAAEGSLPTSGPEVASMAAASTRTAIGRVGGGEVEAGRRIVDREIRPLRDRYRRRADRSRRYYRLGGLATLLMGVSLPLLAGLDFVHRDLVLSIASISVAALTGLREFYQWDQMWSVHRRSENALSDELVRWELRLEQLGNSGDAEAAGRDSYRATEDLLKAARAIREAESDRFFGGLGFPGPTSDVEARATTRRDRQ